MLKNFLLKKITSTGIGGPARSSVEVKNEAELTDAVNWARENRQKYFLIGDGTNLIPSDKGFGGLIVRNKIKKFEATGGSVFLGAGNNLFASIRRLNRLGLGGMEKMAGIPGTVGGALYGCAGAYGQEIKDHLTRIHILNVSRFNLKTLGRGRWLTRKQCQFGYRDSVFQKHPEWIIIGAEFKLAKRDPKTLQKTSAEIVKTRSKKYPPGLRCPGSFFKNIVINQIKPATFRKKILAEIKPGPVRDSLSNGASKLPAAYFLEQVGAKGMRRGAIAVADYHANLIYNTGNGRASDIQKLASLLKSKVKRKFGIKLEEEIRYIE